MNYNNFVRPEPQIDHGFEHVMDEGFPCEECGKLCDERFCSSTCEEDAQTGEPDEDGCPEEMEFEDDGQPTEYEEWQDYMGGDDSDHGNYGDGLFDE